MTTHSTILAGTQEPGDLQLMGLQRALHDSTHTSPVQLYGKNLILVTTLVVKFFLSFLLWDIFHSPSEIGRNFA